MTKLQFRVLYREFLFRMVDLELLSAHALGDSNRLLGQFASLLIFFSMHSFGAGVGVRGKVAGGTGLPTACLRALRDCHQHAGGGTIRGAVLGLDVSQPARRPGAGAATGAAADDFPRQSDGGRGSVGTDDRGAERLARCDLAAGTGQFEPAGDGARAALGQGAAAGRSCRHGPDSASAIWRNR